MAPDSMARYISLLEADYDRLKAQAGELPVQVDTLRNGLAMAVGIITELGPGPDKQPDIDMMMEILDKTNWSAK